MPSVTQPLNMSQLADFLRRHDVLDRVTEVRLEAIKYLFLEIKTLSFRKFFWEFRR